MILNSVVTRTIGVDFIYLDLLFLTLWISFLIKKRYWMPIIWGILGWFIYLFVDYYLWYIVMNSRLYEGPIDPLLFFLWFCFSPGFAQFSYVAIMFEKRSWRELWLWTLFFYVGWILIGTVSQIIPIDDRIIQVSRNMNINNQRLTFTLMTVGNIIIAGILVLIKKLRLEDAVYLFIIGTLVEFCLELSLSVTGIRLEQGTWSFGLLIINTLIEFNMGIILMYLLWTPLKYKRDRRNFPPLSFRDFKEIKTDFNLINGLSELKEQLSSTDNKRLKIFNKEEVISDLAYYFKKYRNQPFDEPSMKIYLEKLYSEK